MCVVLFYPFCCSGLDKKQREVAMIAEMIHSASLIHDDVIDQSDFRRGKPSVNALWSHKKVRTVLLHLLSNNNVYLHRMYINVHTMYIYSS